MMKVGVLALQGAVSEHIEYLKKAMEKLGLEGEILEVRRRGEVRELDGIVLPGGESTALSLLLRKNGIFEDVRGVGAIMGTCAGAVLLSKNISGGVAGQETLGLMDIGLVRNGYGGQLESFCAPLETSLGAIEGIFIRAPVIESVSGGLTVLAEHLGMPVGVQQGNYLATTFHPELSGSTAFHEHFLKLNK
ncbi:pyridoxal 5'-phosphate synthase glutaminase subunit PdxT [Candidatus Micrarchaeota archaeon]|nr:pyridoxal 5'-phosphate synthase glutaminase subunit PdxT [Candidatus Micrarchaeota archaeon]